MLSAAALIFLEDIKLAFSRDRIDYLFSLIRGLENGQALKYPLWKCYENSNTYC